MKFFFTCVLYADKLRVQPAVDAPSTHYLGFQCGLQSVNPAPLPVDSDDP
jgi:hypothetical protein